MSNQDLTSHPLIQLVDEVARIQGRIKSLFADVHMGTGLNGMNDLVLNAISEADRPPTVPQIGRSLGHPRQVIQRAVNDLVEAGYLKKIPNPDHKRASLFGLTDKGLRLKQHSDAQALAIADAFLERMSGKQCQQLSEGLRKVRKEMESFSRQQKPSGKS